MLRADSAECCVLIVMLSVVMPSVVAPLSDGLGPNVIKPLTTVIYECL